MQEDSLLRRTHASAHHGANRANKTDAENQPGVGSHETVAPTVCVKSASSDTDDADSEASVQESVVQVGAFEGRHAAIFSGFAVEDEAVVESALRLEDACLVGAHLMASRVPPKMAPP